MTAPEAVLLLVSVGRFGCFDNRATSLREYDIFIRASIEGLIQALFEGLVFFLCSLIPDVCRYSFEDAVYLGRYRASLRDVMVCQTLCHFSSRMWFSYPQPLPSRVRFILADIVPLFERRWSAKPRSTSLRECGLLLTPAASLRECGFYLICSASLRECGLLLTPAASLRECGFHLICSASLRDHLSSRVWSTIPCRLSSRVSVGFLLCRPTEFIASVCRHRSASDAKVCQLLAKDRRPIPLAVIEARVFDNSSVVREIISSRADIQYIESVLKRHDMWDMSAIEND
ncbi:hypothetical protein AtubIFM57258_005928 [Aspergillus tubingensis]|nr:hypothetical protein AtubIFM57258_005928 [Aspergillus tubingensis]